MRSQPKVFILCVALTLLLNPSVGSFPTTAAPTLFTSWKIVGQVGGPTQAVAIQGNYAFVGVGLRLMILNVANPQAPVEVGSSVPFSSPVEGVVASGTRVFVAAGMAGLHIFNVADPSNPVELGAWDSPGYAEAVAIDGNVAYLADGPYGLRVVDISNLAKPTPISSAYEMNYAFGIALSGNFAYLAAAGAGLLVVDITDPLHPVETARFDTPGYAFSVSISGSLAFVADAWKGLQIINITDPAHPRSFTAVQTTGWAMKVALAGTTAYVADGKGGLQVVNFSGAPAISGTIQVNDLAMDVAVSGGRAFVADFTAGLSILDVTDPANIIEAGRYAPLANARRVVVSGSYAYVAATSAGMRVVDVSDPTHPKEVGKFETGSLSYAAAIDVKDNLVYLGVDFNTPYSLYVLDVSNPANPQAVGRLPTTGEFWDLTLRQNFLYVAYNDGLLVVDVGNPALPAAIGKIDFLGDSFNTTGITLQGNYTYLAESGSGLRIVNVSDPRNPILTSVYRAPGWVSSCAVNGNWAFVLDGRLRVVDISNPAQPLEKASLGTPGSNTEILYDNGRLYISDGGAGLSIVNVANPLNPILEQVVDTPSYASDTFLAGDTAYIADGFGGLIILQKVSGATPAKIPPIDPAQVQVSTSLPWDQPDIDIPAYPPLQQDRPNLQLVEKLAKPNGAQSTATKRVVVSASDAGPGTLRQALLDALAGDTITFDPTVFPPTDPVTITLESNLPPVTQGTLTLDASNAGVILDGTQVPWFAIGLDLASDWNTVRGFTMVGFKPFGLRTDGSHNIIGGSRAVGTGPSGQGNVLSGNNTGIHVGASDNQVLGNLIGTDVSGTQALPNDYGIQVFGKNNRIGGPTAAERNVVSGNRWTGIQIIMDYTVGNVVAGNLIGTDITGEIALGNFKGITIEVEASMNTIGGDTPAERNVISGNTVGAIQIGDPKSYHNSIIGNYIGISASGTKDLGNNFGVAIDYTGFNRVGGTASGEGNVISGNGYGLGFSPYVYPHNLVLGNLIGTDPAGKMSLGNDMGIGIGRARQLFLGGMTSEEANLISGNHGNGIVLEETGTEANFILGNRIGLDITGSQSLPNAASGIWLNPYPRSNFIQGNVIAYNAVAGVSIDGATEITLRRNLIFDHPQPGIDLENGANHDLPAPILTTITDNSVSGLACPGCTVEIFSDTEDEGGFFEGDTIADSSGYFVFYKYTLLSGPLLTATQTDIQGNTSEFSAVRFLHEFYSYLSIILKSP